MPETMRFFLDLELYEADPQLVDTDMDGYAADIVNFTGREPNIDTLAQLVLMTWGISELKAALQISGLDIASFYVRPYVALSDIDGAPVALPRKGGGSRRSKRAQNRAFRELEAELARADEPRPIVP